MDKLNGTFDQLLSVMKEILEPYSFAEQTKFFAGNAKDFYRIQ